MNRAVFMDRDGTIIKEWGYTADPKQVELLPRVATAIKLLRKNGFKILLVSNQSGVSRGYFSINDVQAVNERLLKLLKKDAYSLTDTNRGSRVLKGESRCPSGLPLIDKIYFCPHSPEDNCDCRKPKPGMINRAKSEFDVDLTHSYIIGDRSEDIELGKTTNLWTILVLTGYGKYTLEKNPNSKIQIPNLIETGEKLSESGINTLRPVTPDFVAKDLLEAAEWICKDGLKGR